MNKNLNEKQKQGMAEAAAPWETDAEAAAREAGKKEKSPFKKAVNPNRTPRDSAKALAQKGIPKESFNGEYDDEAGMAEGSLHTLKRAVDGLMSTIDKNDNLPEWCQEKISLAEDYLVTVWDYIQSEKAKGVDPELNEHKKGVRAMKYTSKPRNFVAKNMTTSGAGEHKDKKKETKKGNLKHKKKPEHSLAESNWYEIRLNTLLENSLKKK
jgi:hypothetical protein